MDIDTLDYDFILILGEDLECITKAHERKQCIKNMLMDHLAQYTELDTYELLELKIEPILGYMESQNMINSSESQIVIGDLMAELGEGTYNDRDSVATNNDAMSEPTSMALAGGPGRNSGNRRIQ